MGTVGIVAFAFGAPSSIRSNQLIGQIATGEAWGLKAPIYTQLDIHIESGVEVTYADEKPGEPPTTLRIARGAVGWAKQRGLTELWVAAAAPHLWRAWRDLRKAVREAGGGIHVRPCPEIELYPWNGWFSADSTQQRTRSEKTWNRRERVLKLMPFWLYKRVAS
ncbi:MAG: hypothetical protein HYS89_01725 [Candidatus Colwellbacteria bacterium]|nr:hypothetical protein [Candidatus Colwellbacteria bacterium]